MAAGGGGLGSVLHMIATLKNNRTLLNRRTRFNRKQHYFEIDREDYLYASKIKTKKAPITEEQLDNIRISSLKEKLYERKKMILFVVFFVIGISTISFRISNKIIKSQISYRQQSEKILEQNRINESKEKLDKYLFLISDGDKWFNKKEYYNAKYQYNLALELNYNNQEAIQRLILVYAQECIDENDNCKISIKNLKEISLKYPENKILYENLIMCQDIIGDTVEIEKHKEILKSLNSN